MSSLKQGSRVKDGRVRNLTLALALICPGLVQLMIWYVWYPAVGYTPASLAVALVASPVLAMFLIASGRLSWRRLGVGLPEAGWAVGLILAAYAVLLVGGMVWNAAGLSPVFLLRSTYRLDAFLSSWVLTGLGEELLFAGALYGLTRLNLPAQRRWLAVLTVAGSFVLFHLPGYLARDLTALNVFGRLALNALSWLCFGAIYALSGNLWLAACAHASTDYPLLPMVTDAPVAGLIFTGLLVVAAWWSQSRVGGAASAIETTDNATTLVPGKASR